MKKIVIVLGPTAVGKSDIGVQLAEKFNGEIISADSVQIYKGLNIGSAKVTKEEMKGVPHHCIDILSPASEFSVFEFVELTKKTIDEIMSRGKLPIIVGGTGLYVRALLGGYSFGGTSKNEEYREELEGMGIDNLYAELQSKDPIGCAKIDKNNKKRLIRALEILKFGNKPSESKTEYDSFVINLSMDREKLYNRINRRVDIMLEKGLLNEVKELLNGKVSPKSQSMNGIGYKEVISYLNGEVDYSTMVELIKQHSRNYAKRQMTFFRSVKEGKIYDAENKEEAVENISQDIKGWL